MPISGCIDYVHSDQNNGNNIYPFSKTAQNYPKNIISTATPIKFTQTSDEDVKAKVFEIFNLSKNCSQDILSTNDGRYEKPILKITNSNIDLSSENFAIIESAYNFSHNIRSIIACDKEKCQPKLILENQENNRLTEINWKGQIPSRPIGRLMWLNDNILIFVQQNGPAAAIIAAIDIKENRFIVYLLSENQC